LSTPTTPGYSTQQARDPPDAYVTIVTPRTFARWVSAESKPVAKSVETAAKPGRPRTAEEIRELVLKLARENAWGYTRIHGELKKLGLGKRISRSTVVNILKEAGIDTAPRREDGSWDSFLKRHAATLWACDFFSKKVCTKAGFVEYFVLLFLHVGSRRVYFAGASPRPNAAWVEARATDFLKHVADTNQQATILLRDLDSKFTTEFDAALEAGRVKPHKVGPAAMNLNAHCERLILSVKSECLDHFIIFGETHLRHLLDTWIDHYHTARPHQGKENKLLTGLDPPEWNGTISLDEIVRHESLGGLLKRYERKAA